jgi:beta-galactosidase
VARLDVTVLCSLAVAASSFQRPVSAGVTIAKILPFAGAENVRLEASVAGDEEVRGAEMRGRIVPIPDGPALWEGVIARFDLRRDDPTMVRRTIEGLQPRLWSPTSPELYELVVTAAKDGQTLATERVRFGFRSFESRDGQCLLNGKPIFLRGNAINPPGRGVPNEVGETREFAEAYVRYMKSQNVNLIRLGGDSQVWADVCDELGMMVFQGRYGAPRGGSKSALPPDFDEAIATYKSEIFEQYVSHPSVVIYILTNEVPYKGDLGEQYMPFLSRVHETLRKWDPNRLYIGNAGFGGGLAGDIRDGHPYWGWYSGDFLGYYRLRQDENPRPGPAQPWTFSECVGCYTTPDGRFDVGGKLLCAQEYRTGHAADQSAAALAYQASMVKQGTEIVRRLRPINPNLAGIMPFTGMFFNWYGVSTFEDMKPKPAMEQLGVSMQPVLLSWEMWTPQVYSGALVRAVAHIVNDSDDYADLTGAQLTYEVRGKDGERLAGGQTQLPRVPYYEARSVAVQVHVPRATPTGEYVIQGEITSAGEIVSHNTTDLFVATDDWSKPARAPDSPVALYDPVGKTAKALRRLGIAFDRVKRVEDASGEAPLVIGEQVWDKRLSASRPRLAKMLMDGGRILCLRQDGGALDMSWLPVEVTLATSGGEPYRNGMDINIERPWHPAFEGITRERLAVWSDYSRWDETKPGYPRSHPVTLGYRLAEPESLDRTAVLANFDRGLASMALCEVFDGDGSVILSGFDLVNRSGLDPVADRLLANLVRYAASEESHHAHPLIDSPVVWGDYASERGLVTSVLNGLIVNAVRARPAAHSVPHGRRPFGPFTYNGLCHIVDLNPESKVGSGAFWARVPTGTTAVVTKVENPTEDDAELEVAVNGSGEEGASIIPAGQTETIRRDIPAGATQVSVRYAGDKRLVLLETAFE